MHVYIHVALSYWHNHFLKTLNTSMTCLNGSLFKLNSENRPMALLLKMNQKIKKYNHRS